MIELDEFQNEAAHTDKKRVAISAAPGSGKTATIVSRFHYMTQELKINASFIAVCTFTRRAAQEFRGRIGSTGRLAYMGTFHSLSLALIKSYGHTIGYEGHWLSILDELEVIDEEKAILKDMGLINSRGSWSRGCGESVWRDFKGRILSGEITADSDLQGIDKDMALVWKMHMERLRAENALTFDTLILEALRLFDNPETAKSIRAKYKHFIGDEMQDASEKEWKLIEALKPETLFLVFDENQSIYGWRFAKPELCIEYAAEPDTAHYLLNRSYRFGINIAKPANALISHNDNQVDKAITAIATNEGTVQVVHDAVEADIAEIIKTELASGRKPEEIAILARRHDTLIKLADVLQREQIEFTRLQGGRDAVNKSGAFRTVKGYLRLAVNNEDRRAFMAVATAEGISTIDLLSLRAESNNKNISLSEAYGKKMPETFKDVQKRLGNEAGVASMVDYAPSFKWINDIITYDVIIDMAELVEYLSMEGMADQMRSIQDTVLLSTIHASKGLEWPVVLIIGMNAGIFPSLRTIKEGRLAESRRLMYVALTRATEKCYVIQNVPEDVRDGPSQFLAELGELPEYKTENENEDEDDLVY